MKYLAKLGTAILTSCVLFTACTNGASTASTASTQETEVITVGASLTPHAEILAQIEPLLAEQGYALEVVEYTDYILPNTALEAGDLDANFFQHTPYLEEFNAQNETDISAAVAVHFEPLGIYSNTHNDLQDIPHAAKIAVPNDATNEARALLLLQEEGILTLSPDVGISATKLDIIENPYQVEIVEIEASQLARVLPDVDFACINGNYALQGGLTAEDALTFEASSSLSAQTYANILAVQTEDLESDKTRALATALADESVKLFIENSYEGAVVPVF